MMLEQYYVEECNQYVFPYKNYYIRVKKEFIENLESSIEGNITKEKLSDNISSEVWKDVFISL